MSVHSIARPDVSTRVPGTSRPGSGTRARGSAGDYRSRRHLALVQSRVGDGINSRRIGADQDAAPERDFRWRVGTDFTPNISLFGSLGRTIGVAAEDGAGTTLSFGVSLTAGPLIFERR